MNDAFLRCQGLSKRFGNVLAVDGADLVAERGHIMALLGPSGCGKTTLLRLVAGFESPDAGSIELGGRVLTARSVFVPPERRRVGMVFQDYALFPHLDVAANVTFGVPRERDRRKVVERLLGLVGLDGLGKRMPHELSGGQQQRVALARTLAAEPELVLLDEPFSNLDPSMRTRVRTEVRQILLALGMTAVFVTHDHEEALSIAEEVAVMLSGRILQIGAPADVYRKPATREVAEFLGDANMLPGSARGGIVTSALGATPVPAALDGAVLVLIRPEDLALTSAAGATGDVVMREYYGHDQMITVRLSDGTILKVRDVAGRQVAIGETHNVALRGDVVVFPAG